jgi:methyl-accepting chemotaxis protein
VKFLKILAILALSGLLINSITMTQQMKKIESSLEDNLESIQKLNLVQASIINKNKELGQMIITLDQLDKNLDDVIGKTGKTLTLLTEVVNYNSGSLALNEEMENSSKTAGAQISAVNSSMSKLSPYLSDLDQLLKQLAATAKKDEQHLNDIYHSTKELNQKTPGVKLP